MYFEVEEHYYTINKIFLKILGIWPDESSCFKVLQQALVIILMTTYIGMQFALFITTKCDLNLFVEILSMAVPYILGEVLYCVFVFQSQIVVQLHRRIQEDWMILQNTAEIEIVSRYINKSLFYAVTLFLISGLGIIFGCVVQFLSVILDFIFPLDEPRPRKLLLPVEYFVSENKYFYTKVLHECVIFTIFAMILVSTGTQLITFSYHCLGMFKIASYRVSHSITDSILQVSDFEWEHAFCKKIMHAVISHRRAMEFSNFLASSFNLPFCIACMVAIISLSLNAYKLIFAIKIANNISNTLISLSIILSEMFFMLLISHIGETINDYQLEVCTSSYDISWYLIPVSSQKLLLFLMQKTSKEFYLTVGYILVGRIQSFVSFLNIALSYVTVMWAIQNKQAIDK